MPSNVSTIVKPSLGNFAPVYASNAPRIIAALLDGIAPADLTVTCLAKALPYSWAEQERSVGLQS